MQRTSIDKLLQRNSGLKLRLDEALIESWTEARDLAIAETDLPDSNFLEICPFSLEKIMNPDFFPFLPFALKPIADNATVRLDLDNEPQLDALLRIKSDFGGQSHISDDDYIEGAPELVEEISGSTVPYDLYDKLTVYRRHGVQEYIVWRVYDQAIN